MKEFLLPYGKETLKAGIEEEHLAGVLVSGLHDYKAPMDGSRLVQEALEHPIGTPRLCDMAIGRKKIVIISSDHTRPVPSRIIMPLLLKEIRRGNPDAEVTIVISTGLHRETTREELEAKFGQEIMEQETIVVHDCDDQENLVYLGKLPSGGNMYINRLAVEADLLVAEGFIEPHFFAGFSGGRKSVLPGVASRETVMYNHNSAFIADDHARTGVIEGNPIHNDMLYAARAARLDFIVNVVIDAAHDPIFAVAGDCDLAHRAGREFLASRCQVDAVLADIVISTNGGYPLDQNIYQSVKGMTAAEATVKEGGVIIMLSQAADGHGGRYFHETFRDEKDLNRMMKTFLDRKPQETIIDQWQSQIFARVLLKARVVFVSSCEDRLVEELHMIPAHSMEEALEKAKEIVNREDYKVTVIPDGVSVIVREGKEAVG
ncbi:MAG: nickel-dependent lactate racemase [Lachnospiraceae bacterium]|jgi:nickel-dependent lactate racemase|nr:nickel-dependent lactate racemase [Lachnospiraceae bacterium]